MDVIKFQCSHCNTLYDSMDHCPTCGSLSQDAIQINYSQNIKNRKKELALDTYFYPIYQLFYIVHFITCLSWFGMWLSIPTIILHLVHTFVMKKKTSSNTQNEPRTSSPKKQMLFQIIRIIDMVLCVPAVLAMIGIYILEI